MVAQYVFRDSSMGFHPLHERLEIGEWAIAVSVRARMS
jgi:hypothetical protein